MKRSLASKPEVSNAFAKACSQIEGCHLDPTARQRHRERGLQMLARRRRHRHQPRSTMSTRTILQTTRLRLREFNADDLATLTHMHRDPRVCALLVDDYPLHDTHSALAFIAALGRIYRSHEGFGIWHSECLVDGRWLPCGWFNLLPLDEAGCSDASEAEIGCRLLPQYWGTGLALEGGQLLLAHAFESLALSRVLGLCHPNNRSVKLTLLTLGFQARAERDYGGRRASQFVMDAAQWRATCGHARRLRTRQALHALRTLEMKN
jgi:RimJ/RimL family protein N-acetyltransferase